MQKNQIDDELNKALNELEVCDTALKSDDMPAAKRALAEAVEKIRLLRRNL